MFFFPLISEFTIKYFFFSQGRQSSTRSTTYLEGPAGTGQPQVHYPKLDFDPVCCFSLGSPIGLFLSARGMEIIGESFTFPTCQKFFNIFHPVSVFLSQSLGIIGPDKHNYEHEIQG